MSTDGSESARGLLQVKMSRGAIGPYLLRRYACECGWVGPWHATDVDARGSFDRHAERHDAEQAS